MNDEEKFDLALRLAYEQGWITSPDFATATVSPLGNKVLGEDFMANRAMFDLYVSHPNPRIAGISFLAARATDAGKSN